LIKFFLARNTSASAGFTVPGMEYLRRDFLGSGEEGSRKS
jgi:hypothetical protein